MSIAAMLPPNGTSILIKIKLNTGQALHFNSDFYLLCGRSGYTDTSIYLCNDGYDSAIIRTTSEVHPVNDLAPFPFPLFFWS